jgi:hypothetical protein
MKIKCYEVTHRLPEETRNTIILMYATSIKKAKQQLIAIYSDVIIIKIKEIKL